MADKTKRLRIGRVPLGEQPRVVLAVGGAHRSLTRALAPAVDFIEARIDMLARPRPQNAVAAVQRLRACGLPIIGTVRSSAEGGQAKLSDVARTELYSCILPLVAAVDLELRSASALRQTIAATKDQGRTLILSFHDFERTPTRRALESIFEKSKLAGADIVKIAAQARGNEDVLRLLQFTLDHRDDHVVTIAMGTLGSVSRLVFAMAGSLLTYTNVKPAHGQIPLARLVEDLRFYFPAYAARFAKRK